MIEQLIAGNLKRIALHRDSLAQLSAGAGSHVLYDFGEARLLDWIAELEDVNAYLARLR